FRGDHMIVLEVAAAPAVVDAHISPDDPAQFAEPLQERCITRLSFGIVRHPGHKHADAPSTLRLLRARRERPCRRRAAEQRDELAAFHCPMPPALSIESVAPPQLRQETAALRHFGPVYVADGSKAEKLR